MSILAVILPLGRTQFLSDAALPLAGGSVGYYIPMTLTAKDTWRDPQQSALNTNPIGLDAAGSAYIFGAGSYRMIVKDNQGNTVYDALTEGVLPSDVSGAGFGAQQPIAADATVDLGTITSHNALITGNASVASFGDSAELSAPLYYVEIDTGVSIDNSDALLTPGSQTLLLEAGDALLCEFLGTANWKIISVWPKRGISTGFGTQQNVPTAAGIADIGVVNTNNVQLTSADAITSLGNSASLTRPLYLTYFSQACVLTQGASLMLLGGANISAKIGSVALWEFLGAGIWQMLFYGNADGSPLSNALSPGRVLVETAYTAHGVYTYTVPVGTTTLDVTVVGSGASGAGAGSSSSGHSMASPGGSAGASSRGTIISPTASYTVTVGQGGAQTAAGANDGNAGAPSSFGTIIVCGGAAASSHGADAGASGSVNVPGAGGLVTAAGNMWAQTGESGQVGVSFGSDLSKSGDGGAGPLGGRGIGAATVGNTAFLSGGAARGPGSGGGGGGTSSDGSAFNASGGAGFDGAVFVTALS